MSMDKQINDFLNRYHINHKYTGYNFLMSIIRMMLMEEVPRGRVGEAYALYGKNNDRQPKTIERSIRKTLDAAGVEMSNKQFITLAVDEVMYQGVD